MRAQAKGYLPANKDDIPGPGGYLGYRKVEERLLAERSEMFVGVFGGKQYISQINVYY